MRLAGHTALVTGASRGIGRAIALALAAEGADIAINFLFSASPAKQLVKDIQEMGRMVTEIPEKVQAKLLEQIPMRRFGTVDEVARACVYLCSSDGDYITGSELKINGGLYM